MLERLGEPASASQVAAELDLPRQRVGYHLRELEKVGLVHLVGERQRRGCTERLLQTTATTFVVDPGVIGGAPPSRAAVRAQDRYAASHLVAAASASPAGEGWSVLAVLSTYGLADEAFAAVEQRWADWWTPRYGQVDHGS